MNVSAEKELDRHPQDTVQQVATELCELYGIEIDHLRLSEMSSDDAGLGNAVPIAIPYRRRYWVRYHQALRREDPLVLRGLLAHEFVHVLHYSKSSYAELLTFAYRYAMFAVTAASKRPKYDAWAKQIEHLTDLIACKFGEAASLIAWKRFKAESMSKGWLKDDWDAMYISIDELGELDADASLLNKRIESCLAALGAYNELRPFGSAPR